MKKNMNKITNMLLANAAMGAALSVEEAKLVSAALNGRK